MALLAKVLAKREEEALENNMVIDNELTAEFCRYAKRTVG